MSNIIFKIRRYLKKHLQEILIVVTCISILYSVMFIFIPYKKTNITKKVEKTITNIKVKETKAQTQEGIILKGNEEIADEIIQGLWGSGSERYSRLTDNGYDAVAIQKIVNEKLPTTVLSSTNTQEVTISTPQSINEIAYTIWIILINNGYSKEVCAGILGNIQQECGFNWNRGSKSGIGICQWGGSRRIALISKYGENPNLESQVKFLMEELQGYQQINNCNTVMEAADYFCYKFERPGIPAITKRRTYAEYWYNLFK